MPKFQPKLHFCNSNSTTSSMNNTTLTSSQKSELESQNIKENETLEGEVIEINPRDVTIKISDNHIGLVPTTEFRYNPDLKIGDKVEVYIDPVENRNGQLVISHKRARKLNAWDHATEAFNNDETIKGYVKSRVKGGFIVDVFGIESFLPISHVGLKTNDKFLSLVNQALEVKIIKINSEFRNIVVSHSVLINNPEPYPEGNDDWEEEPNDYYDEDIWNEEDTSLAEAELNPPPISYMRHTHGVLKCPYCGSSSISSYIDGTAICQRCYKWFRYD